MRNGPTLPIAAMLAAALLAGAAVVSLLLRSDGLMALSERELGLVAWALTLAIFGVQGAISIVLEGQELCPGRIGPRLTAPLSLALGSCSVLLFTMAIVLGLAIVSGQPPAIVGSAAGAGAITLALILLLFKEAFVGDEAHLEARDDGIPW